MIPFRFWMTWHPLGPWLGYPWMYSTRKRPILTPQIFLEEKKTHYQKSKSKRFLGRPPLELWHHFFHFFRIFVLLPIYFYQILLFWIFYISHIRIWKWYGYDKPLKLTSQEHVFLIFSHDETGIVKPKSFFT